MADERLEAELVIVSLCKPIAISPLAFAHLLTQAAQRVRNARIQLTM